MAVEITEFDTKPIVCSMGVDITGFVFTLNAVHTETGMRIEIQGVNTDEANGVLEIPRTSDSFPSGTYEAQFTVTHATGTETSETFYVNSNKRV